MRLLFTYLFISILSNTDTIAQIPATYADLIPLCHTLGTEKTLVGLGESTHGTAEFTKIRSEIVKQLVTKYNYRVFILEAEFATCEKMNKYLHSGEGNLDSLMLDLRLFPWVHEDFKVILEWMMMYNQLHPDDGIRFYGMDAQYSKLYAQKDTIIKHYPNEGKQLFEIVEGNISPKQKISDIKHLSNSLALASDTIDLRLQYFITCQLNKLSATTFNTDAYRNENMAQFVKWIYKNGDDTTKLIIWAHNGHLKKQGGKPMGQYLSDAYGDKYVCVGLDFKEGTFLAVDYDAVADRKLVSMTLNPIEKTIAQELDFGGKTIELIRCDTLKRNVYINAIGAIYVKQPEKKAAFYNKLHRDKQFDYLVITKMSTPIRLLPQYLNN
ncbi:MAG TPA: erythromycin esterase family protein [Chitinophagales bacterium]|nr:erythromycin esterase family protein [Chitinophagales bacterium]